MCPDEPERDSGRGVKEGRGHLKGIWENAGDEEDEESAEGKADEESRCREGGRQRLGCHES